MSDTHAMPVCILCKTAWGRAHHMLLFRHRLSMPQPFKQQWQALTRLYFSHIASIRHQVSVKPE